MIGKVEMLEKQTDEFRSYTHEALLKIFEKLDKIHGDMIELAAKPICLTPNECIRVMEELKIQRGALEDHNRRLMEYDLERQKILGGKTVIVIAIIFIGWCVDAAINWLHKG